MAYAKLWAAQYGVLPENYRQRQGRMNSQVLHEHATPEILAQRWIDGDSFNTIAVDLDVPVSTVRRRIEQARKDFPDLPWGERKPKRAASPTKAFTAMKDGSAGDTALKSGSVIRSSALRRR